MSDAVFERDGERFIPTALSGSPWSDDLVHGGPPAGLLARAIERHAASDALHVVRLTIDLFRPVPKAPLTVSARSVREGRRIHVVDAVITAGGVEISRASGLLLHATEGVLQVSGAMRPPPGPETVERSPMVGAPGIRRREGFHTASEIRRLPRGESSPPTSWVRVPQLVADETMTPLVRLAAACDFVNAVATMSGGPRTGFGTINTDSTIYVHRLPVGEWIALQVERMLEPFGIGVSDAVLFDQDGAIGRASQAVLANEMR